METSVKRTASGLSDRLKKFEVPSEPASSAPVSRSVAKPRKVRELPTTCKVQTNLNQNSCLIGSLKLCLLCLISFSCLC